MQDINSNKDYEKKNEKSINMKNIEKERKYSKKAFIYGLAASTLIGLGMYFSNKIGIDTFSKELKDLNNYEIVADFLFGLSSMTTLIGGTMYGMSYVLNENKDNEEKINKLERDLID